MVIVSSELDEILALGDRIAVMYDGAILEILERSQATRERCGMLMAGLSGVVVSDDPVTESTTETQSAPGPPPPPPGEDTTPS